ncbi:MAG: tripartite tricarboxylate transporter substrate binding protein [Xanthobacteraceae bacterium]|nr:tripartite tricarboxylate transporter substrate binding protein [Xanthobacteraceae bacterium]
MVRALRLITSAAVVVCTTAAPAQDYPNRTIRIIVQTQPGGLIDQIGRTLAQKLTENTGAVVVVENRTGGGGLIAAEHVINSPADGYTLYIASHGSQAIHPHLTKNLSFDPVKAFAPVIYLATTPTLVVVNPSVPAKTLKELIALAGANPGKYTYASQGNGSSGHVAAEQFKQLAGVDLVHVPYKGAAPAVRDLVAGHVSVMFDTVAFSQEQVTGGKLRALAVGADARVKSLPDVPTMAEAGLPQMQGSPWFGVVVAAGTPRPVIDWLNREAAKAFTAKDVQQRFAAQGFTLPLGTPEAFAAHIAMESKRWGGR